MSKDLVSIVPLFTVLIGQSVSQVVLSCFWGVEILQYTRIKDNKTIERLQRVMKIQTSQSTTVALQMTIIASTKQFNHKKIVIVLRYPLLFLLVPRRPLLFEYTSFYCLNSSHFHARLIMRRIREESNTTPWHSSNNSVQIKFNLCLISAEHFDEKPAKLTDSKIFYSRNNFICKKNKARARSRERLPRELTY